MKRYITISIFFFWQTTFVSGQTIEVKAKIDSLKYLGVDAFNCNSVFWRIIANRKEAVLRLIDKISDTTITTATWKCKSTNLRVGDIAYLALREIIPVPFSDITGKQYDVIYDGCQGGVSKYIELNRLIFQKQVRIWYPKNRAKFKWVKYNNKQLTDCRRINNIVGHYQYK